MNERTNKETHEKQKNIEKGSEMGPKINEKSEVGGAFGGPGGILGISGRLCRKSGAQEEAKMQPRWPKMLPKKPT